MKKEYTRLEKIIYWKNKIAEMNEKIAYARNRIVKLTLEETNPENYQDWNSDLEKELISKKGEGESR